MKDKLNKLKAHITITDELIQNYTRMEKKKALDPTWEPNSRYQQRNLGGIPIYRAYKTGVYVDYTQGDARADIARKCNQFGYKLGREFNKKLINIVTSEKDIHYQRPLSIYKEDTFYKQFSDFFLHKGTKLRNGQVLEDDVTVDTTHMSIIGEDGTRNSFNNNIRYKDNKYKDVQGRVIVVVNDEINISHISYEYKNINIINISNFVL